MGLRWRLAAVGLVSVVVLGACGGGGETTETRGVETTGGGKAKPVKLDFAAAAKENCEKVKSGRVLATVALSGGHLAKEVTVGFTGVFDNASRRAHLKMDLSKLAEVARGDGLPEGAPPGALDMEIIVDGNTTYMKSAFFGALLGGGGGKPWVKLPAGADGGGEMSPGFFGSDVCQVSELLGGVFGDVETVGTETVNGARTTHLKAKVDLAKAASAAGGKDAAEGLEELMKSAGVNKVPIELWVDEDGILRRVSLSFASFDVSNFGGGAAGGTGAGSGAAPKKASARFTIDIVDVNKPVKIELPPPDQVTEPGGLFGGSIPSIPEAPGE